MIRQLEIGGNKSFKIAVDLVHSVVIDKGKIDAATKT
jgi:hypothetical protein